MKVALIGWRGMVGSVLLEQIIQNQDYKNYQLDLFSTSQAGQAGPQIHGIEFDILKDAYDIQLLSDYDVILTCQGSDYTQNIYPKVKSNNWRGYWVDAASLLRMDDSATICLDPVNNSLIKQSLANGGKTFVGGNCTVSLMLMGLGGLFKNNCVEWVSSMTYQAASGAGAKNMAELINQMKYIGDCGQELLSSGTGIIEIDKKITQAFNNADFPNSEFGHALAGNLLPWIDVPVELGMSKEEWKAMTETNKILNTTSPIPIDGTCVRIGAMRSHSQALTVKINKDIPMDEINQMISEENEWVCVIENDKEKTLNELTPSKVSGTLNIPVGRLRKMRMGNEFLNAFTVGDQLLWGAAEPIRRMVNIIGEYKQ
jgi:aspartate-semialdehyde dehydrogenase